MPQGSPLGSFLGAASPGIASAGKQFAQTGADQKQANAMLPGTTAAADQAMDQFRASPMQDPGHPVWDVLSGLVGGPPGGGAPAAPAPQGIPTDANGMVNAPISIAQQGQMAQPVAGMQNGGVVALNSGDPTVRPTFTRGPAIPTGPNSGIVPASTEGQILTMDSGGVVPDGFVQQPGISGVPMSGRGASLVEGFQAGQNIGHNLRQAWDTNRSREATGQAAKQTVSADVDNSDDGSSHPQGMIGSAKDAVEGFFHHLHEGTLDDNHQPNQPAPGSPSYQPPAAGVPAGPAGAPAGAAPAPSPVAGAAPAAPNGAPPAPGAGPAGAPGAAPAAGQPGAGPNVGAQSPQGQPQPVNPALQAASNAAKADVVSDPNVRAGVPQKSPEESGKPHSLSPDYWRKNNELMQQAVYRAAKAGEDPAKVYESLTAMRTAHFQGQVLKQAAAANIAFQNNDMDSVKRALQNINYYLPNGQDIKFKTASADDAAKDPSVQVGDLMHSNPYANMYGHQHEPAFTKIDQQYIQQLGQGALDPQKMQQAQLASYTAQMEAHEKMTTATGAADTGQGRKMWGAAQLQNSNLKAQNQDVERRLLISKGDLNEANAGKANREPVDRSGSGQPKVTQASIRARQNDVSSYVDKASLGQTEVEPTKNPDGSTNLSAAAGRPIPNPAKIPSVLTGLSPDQRENVKVLGGSFAAANPQMPKEEAAQMAARITRIQSAKVPPTHIEADGKRHVDFYNDQAKGIAHVWVGNGYRSFYTAPVAADESPAASPVQATGGAEPSSDGASDSGPMDND